MERHLTEIFEAFRKALQDLMRPKVLLMVAVPMVCAMALWTLIGWWFWEPLTQWVNGLLQSFKLGQWIAGWSPGVVRFSSAVITLALLAPGVVITALLITEFFTMPGLVNYVAQHYYPELKREHGGTVAGGVANSLVAIVIFAFLWLITLPLWFTGIGALLVPMLNSAYLNQRIFRHDALSDHASRDELRELNTGHRRRFYLLGLMLAVFLYVPVFNLLAPALTGLAFTHYQLGRLARLRLQTKLGLGV
jgi:CysZ protein